MAEDVFEEQGTYDGDINALYELDKSVYAQDLIRHHRFVREYFEQYNNNREVNHNFLRGFHYDDGELRKYRDKRKTPIVFNEIKTSERTILGMWMQRQYDVTFAATSPTNDKMGEVLAQLDTWEQEQQGDDMNDIEIVRQAWCGGNSFQECYMEVTNGKEPQMYSVNQNPFAIYWDPESRRLITRDDAQFVDRDTWMTYPELISRFREAADDISQQLTDHKRGDDGYDEVQVFADRDHEHKKERNGEYMVTERFYKVEGIGHFAEIEGMRIDIDDEDLKDFKRENPGVKVQSELVEELWLAIVCEDFSTQQYLFNGKYHNQPRDPRTGKIMWPILEMIAESLAGEPQGFVDHERGPNKVINSTMSNIVSSATHASAAAMLIDPTAFISERESALAARHHSDSDRAFQVKHGRTNDAMMPIQKTGVNQDNLQALEYAKAFMKEITSTPPATQGLEEEAGVSGKLNEQRMEQGFMQLQPLMKNYRLFLKQRAKLRYYYWRTYYTAEKTFRILDKSEPEMNPFATINGMEPEMDAMGEWTGAIKKINDINAAIYDITIKESVNSPLYRDKQLRYINNLMQSSFAQNDPGLQAGLLEESLRLSDAPEKTKAFLKKYSTLITQAEMAKRQAEQQLGQAQQEGAELDNMTKMQGIAQAEAEQTGTFPPSQGTSGASGAATNIGRDMVTAKTATPQSGLGGGGS